MRCVGGIPHPHGPPPALQSGGFGFEFVCKANHFGSGPPVMMHRSEKPESFRPVAQLLYTLDNGVLFRHPNLLHFWRCATTQGEPQADTPIRSVAIRGAGHEQIGLLVLRLPPA